MVMSSSAFSVVVRWAGQGDILLKFVLLVILTPFFVSLFLLYLLVFIIWLHSIIMFIWCSKCIHFGEILLLTLTFFNQLFHVRAINIKILFI